MPWDRRCRKQFSRRRTKSALGGRRPLSLAPATWGGHGSASLAQSNLERSLRRRGIDRPQYHSLACASRDLGRTTVTSYGGVSARP
jgi:hypothetical protein